MRAHRPWVAQGSTTATRTLELQHPASSSQQPAASTTFQKKSSISTTTTTTAGSHAAHCSAGLASHVPCPMSHLPSPISLGLASCASPAVPVSAGGARWWPIVSRCRRRSRTASAAPDEQGSPGLSRHADRQHWPPPPAHPLAPSPRPLFLVRQTLFQ